MTTGPRATPGRPYPLGATRAIGPDGSAGTNFAVGSQVAEAVTLCLIDPDGTETSIPLLDEDAGVWHAFVPGIGAGQRYGYRASGVFDPARGLRCNSAKLLLDPYARAIAGEVDLGDHVLGHDPAFPDHPSTLDSAGHVPVSLVVDPAFDWQGDHRPEHQLADSVLYEVHVAGFTRTHPGVPPELRGTYAGLAHEAAVGHLVGLGITTVELLPVHHSVPEEFLRARGLTNYWGYNTIGYFAPHAGYSARVAADQDGGQVTEFKEMVRTLHAAGLEVVLDVVFNHTAEGGEGGPTLCHRGLDNPAYYRLDPADRRHYLDTTGCGNSLNVRDPGCLRLIMDALRYWVTDMHVDGFRFDLAPSLARAEGGFDTLAAFFDIVSQDPVISRVKLIAEPWDVGQADSYDLGRFPPLWSEWNGRYRDTMRDFWRLQDGRIGDFATRFAGSSDLFHASDRRPTASVNLITTHDGFTLRDLVSYDHKHNEANGEDNRDGSGDNRSWNGGAEGPTDDAVVLVGRARRQRALLTTLLLSFGVPMLLGGDELGRTQRGNNNAYCQDNELSWFDWAGVDADLLAFTRRVVALRRAHPVFRRRRFLSGVDLAELTWFTPAGGPMRTENWGDPLARGLTVALDGDDAPDRASDGTLLLDDDFLLLVNGWREAIDFTIPAERVDQRWLVELDTGDLDRAGRAVGSLVRVAPQSIVVLRAALTRPGRRPGRRA
ncbi:glycogen debranching protein GlgX [Pengzhenrongella frigida]|uniref:Glycogen debranching enzyme GlgX n=1 Tax=Pengzhenrongella frigida TaxID=1259133 RepID=A0A4Q5N114_9MICO|nr:glycogen debranching protein GlgX [Cellulomonas sp. HLT2-17]RYV50933.1 glycogen debranching enzyme GlgX [Cellulomonas sp. HLT2-17]